MAEPLEHTFKILVTGPFAAGKTSLIQSISQSPVVTTEVATSGDEAAVKANTTVAMDFGTYALDSDAGEEPVHLLLFGTPGQPRFRFMTDILKADVDIVAFVVDGLAEDTFDEAAEMLTTVMDGLRAPVAVVVNRCDVVDDARAIATRIGAAATAPAIPCQLVDPESGRAVIAEMLDSLLDSTDFALTTPGGAS